jgi:hypothetical protein
MVLGSGIWDPRSGIRDPEKTYSGSRIQGSKSTRSRIRNTAMHESKDPDPFQNVTDPEHWSEENISTKYFFLK